MADMHTRIHSRTTQVSVHLQVDTQLGALNVLKSRKSTAAWKSRPPIDPYLKRSGVARSFTLPDGLAGTAQAACDKCVDVLADCLQLDITESAQDIDDIVARFQGRRRLRLILVTAELGRRL